MADIKMGVVVRAGRGTEWNDVVFGHGNDVKVLDGHLFVYDGVARVIAVYAPGTWLNVQVVY